MRAPRLRPLLSLWRSPLLSLWRSPLLSLWRSPRLSLWRSPLLSLWRSPRLGLRRGPRRRRPRPPRLARRLAWRSAWAASAPLVSVGLRSRSCLLSRLSRAGDAAAFPPMAPRLPPCEPALWFPAPAVPAAVHLACPGELFVDAAVQTSAQGDTYGARRGRQLCTLLHAVV